MFNANVKARPNSVAAADLSALQYTFGALDATGGVVAATANGPAVGVIYNTPTSGQAVQLINEGQAQVYASAAIAAGAEIAVATGGKAKTAASTNTIVGRAVTAASGADVLVTVELLPIAQSVKA